MKDGGVIKRRRLDFSEKEEVMVRLF